MHHTLKDSDLKVRALWRARELREVFRFSLFSCPFFVFAVHSTLFLHLSTIFLTKGGKQNYARLHYLLRATMQAFTFWHPSFTHSFFRSCFIPLTTYTAAACPSLSISRWTSLRIKHSYKDDDLVLEHNRPSFLLKMFSPFFIVWSLLLLLSDRTPYILASRINRFLAARRTVHSCRENSVRLWHDAFQQPKLRNVLEKWQKSIEITWFFRRTVL